MTYISRVKHLKHVRTGSQIVEVTLSLTNKFSFPRFRSDTDAPCIISIQRCGYQCGTERAPNDCKTTQAKKLW